AARAHQRRKAGAWCRFAQRAALLIAHEARRPGGEALPFGGGELLHRALPALPRLEGPQRVADRPIGDALHLEIERRVDLQSLLEGLALADDAPDLSAPLGGVGGRLVEAAASLARHDHRVARVALRLLL